tara:strand:- start:3303 stop:3818 length:516 start_codon:yes stop_codon:yes gene_type:complete
MKKLDIEGIEIEPPKEAQKKEEDMISFSTRLVDLLQDKAGAFSSENDASLTMLQLKKVYCHSARLSKEEGAHNINLSALARVNMFIRLKAGEKMIKKANDKTSESMTELQLESLNCKTVSNFIDISESWVPSESDFEKAQKEIEEKNLDYNYEDPDDLYLEYEPIKPTWGD